MKRPVVLLVGVAAIVLIAWIFLRSGGDERVAVDLVEQFPSAKDKRPTPEVFEVADVTISGVTKRSILVKDPSRLVYSVSVPDDGELKVSIGLLEAGWVIEGDGVLFRVLLGAGGPPEQILNITLNPFANATDRGWHEISLDLSDYAGETVDLFFNTNSSGPARPPQDNRNGDLAVWGAPRLVTR